MLLLTASRGSAIYAASRGSEIYAASRGSGKSQFHHAVGAFLAQVTPSLYIVGLVDKFPFLKDSEGDGESISVVVAFNDNINA